MENLAPYAPPNGGEGRGPPPALPTAATPAPSTMEGSASHFRQRRT